MEMKASTILAALMASLMLVQTLALPMGQASQADQEKSLHADKRPKYMDTRDTAYFKELLLTSLADLINEGVLSADIVVDADKKITGKNDMVPVKRGRGFIGLCFQMTASGSPNAIPCWMNGR